MSASLAPLPFGWCYYSHSNELIINCPIIEENRLSILPMHMITPHNRNLLFGRWHVCPDGKHVQSQHVVKQIDALVQEYMEYVQVIKGFAESKEIQRSGQGAKKWQTLRLSLVCAGIIMLAIACSIIALIIAVKGPIWLV